MGRSTQELKNGLGVRDGRGGELSGRESAVESGEYCGVTSGRGRAGARGGAVRLCESVTTVKLKNRWGPYFCKITRDCRSDWIVGVSGPRVRSRVPLLCRSHATPTNLGGKLGRGRKNRPAARAAAKLIAVRHALPMPCRATNRTGERVRQR